jgi:hypothetical protein
MDTSLLDKLMANLGEEAVSPDVKIVGEDPVFPLSWRVGEAGAVAIAASGVAAARLWRLRTGRSQQVRVDVDAAAAAMRGDRYLRRERPSSNQSPSPRAVRGERATYTSRRTIAGSTCTGDSRTIEPGSPLCSTAQTTPRASSVQCANGMPMSLKMQCTSRAPARA